MSDTFLGHDGDGDPVFLPERVRATHMHVIGASGTGKTKFLEHLIRKDILARRGLCLLDPTGNLYRDLVRWCETKHLLDSHPIALFDPGVDGWAFGFNPLEVAAHNLSYHVDAMVNACAAVWGGEDTNRTPLLKRCLRSLFHALAEHRLTLLEAMDLLHPADPRGIRARLTGHIRDPVIQQQWDWFNQMRPREFLETFGSTANRLMEFLASERIRRTLGQREQVLDLRQVMDRGQILLVNLGSGLTLSKDNASLLGALLVSHLFLKAQGRPKGSRPFYLYIDECSRFVSEDIQCILDEGRQFGLHLILAHQHLSQLLKAGDTVYHAVMTDARTKVVFGGLSPDDAKVMAETVYMGELDLEEAKTSLNKPVVVGHEIIDLRGESHAEGRGMSQATSETRTDTTTQGGGRSHQWSRGTTTGDSWPRLGLMLDGTTHWSTQDGRGGGTSQSWGMGEASSRGASRTDTTSETDTVSWRESLAPLLQTLPTSVYSLEEQIHRAAAGIHTLGQQRAILKLPERPVQTLKVARVEAPFANDQRVQAFQEASFRNSPFARPWDAVDAEMNARQAGLAPSTPPSPAGAQPPPPPPGEAPKADTGFDDFLE